MIKHLIFLAAATAGYLVLELYMRTQGRSVNRSVVADGIFFSNDSNDIPTWPSDL